MIIIEIFISFIGAIGGFLLAYFIIKKRNKSYETDYIQAQNYLINKQYDESISYFKEVLSLINSKNPLYISTLIGLAEAYILKNDKITALDYINRAISSAMQSKNSIIQQQLNRLKNQYVSENNSKTIESLNVEEFPRN